MFSKISNTVCSCIFFLILKFLSLFPLKIIHFFGGMLGQLFHYLKPEIKKTLITNLTNSGLFKNANQNNQAIEENIIEMGKFMLESMVIWGSSQKKILGWIRKVNHMELIDDALKNNNGIIFLSPHIGAFEIASIFYASTNPITVLYRPSRKKCLNNWIKKGRSKGYINLVPTDKSGVKNLLLALKKGQAVGLLPDQIASKGKGEWANFFEKPAYTMTLINKLYLKTNATVIMAVVERLSNSQGFDIHLELIDPLSIESASGLNLALEQQIKKFPTQYMWNYDRHKHP
jgi:KDO2-lipid IV(A) lauroyltransferase